VGGVTDEAAFALAQGGEAGEQGVEGAHRRLQLGQTGRAHRSGGRGIEAGDAVTEPLQRTQQDGHQHGHPGGSEQRADGAGRRQHPGQAFEPVVQVAGVARHRHGHRRCIATTAGGDQAAQPPPGLVAGQLVLVRAAMRGWSPTPMPHRRRRDHQQGAIGIPDRRQIGAFGAHQLGEVGDIEFDAQLAAPVFDLGCQGMQLHRQTGVELVEQGRARHDPAGGTGASRHQPGEQGGADDQTGAQGGHQPGSST